jgi:3-oxo-5-alpha-steroid 4-dehydrogenase 3
VLSVSASLFWGYQLYTRGQATQFIANHTSLEKYDQPVENVILALFLMLCQGLRRLYESVAFRKKNASTKSKMGVAHLALGLLFYFSINIALWVEGTGMFVCG